MKSKKISSILALGVATTIGLSTILTNTVAFAETNQSSETKVSEAVQETRTNTEIIKNKLGDIEYTYDENGNSYKVVEKANKDLTKGTVKTYEKDSDGNYVLITIAETEIDEDNINLKTTDVITNEVSYETTSIDDIVEVTNTKNNIDMNNSDIEKDNNDSKMQKYSAKKSSSTELTGWQYSATFGYNWKVAKYSVTVISNVIFSKIAKLGGPFSGTAGVVIQGIANIIIAEKIPTYFEEVSVYYKYIKGTNLPRAERSYTNIYKDKSRNEKIGKTINYEYYVEGWS